MFLRKDSSVNLPRARQVVLNELHRAFGEVRDYNGGLIAKQLENLSALKTLLGATAKEHAFALENFFFSIEPLIHQTTVHPKLLKEGFLLMLQMANKERGSGIYPCKEGVTVVFLLFSEDFKKKLVSFLERMRGTFLELAYAFTTLQDLLFLALFFPSTDLAKQQLFIENVENSLRMEQEV